MDPLRKAMRARLVADATLKALLAKPDAIYHAFAPEGAQYPYVIFNAQTPDMPLLSMGKKPALIEYLWLVKGVVRGTKADAAEDIDARCTELLNDAPLTIEGKTLLYVLRESGMPPYSEVDSGEPIFHRGGLYRIKVEP